MLLVLMLLKTTSKSIWLHLLMLNARERERGAIIGKYKVVERDQQGRATFCHLSAVHA